MAAPRGFIQAFADVMKLVDMPVLEAGGVTRVGSSPTVRTIPTKNPTGIIKSSQARGELPDSSLAALIVIPIPKCHRLLGLEESCLGCLTCASRA